MTGDMSDVTGERWQEKGDRFFLSFFAIFFWDFFGIVSTACKLQENQRSAVCGIIYFVCNVLSKPPDELLSDS